MKFQPSDALASVTSTTGLFKKMYLYPPISAERNALMKDEDTANGFSEPVAERCAAHRRSPMELTVLNSVLRYGPVGKSNGHAFDPEQGVSRWTGPLAVSTLQAVHVAGTAALGALPATLGDTAAKTGSTTDIVEATLLMLRRIREEVLKLLGPGFTVRVRAGFTTASDFGSRQPLRMTALGGLFGGDALWDRMEFPQRPGHYMIAGYKSVSWFAVQGKYVANDPTTYVRLAKVAYFVIIDGPLLLPIVSCSHSNAHITSVVRGEDATDLPFEASSSADPLVHMTRVTDWGGASASSYKTGAVTWTSTTIAELGGCRLPGFLLGAPTPVDSFLLRRVTLTRTEDDMLSLTCADTDVRYVVSGRIVAGMMDAVDANRTAIEATDYGMWLTNDPVKLPSSIYTLIPHWDQADEADRAEVRSRVVLQEEGVDITVDDVARRAAGKELRSFALILGQVEDANTVESCTITADGPVFSSTADEWLAAYMRGSEYYTFNVKEGLPSQTAYDFIVATRGSPVLAGSSPITIRTGPENKVFEVGAPRPGVMAGTDLFQALLSMFAVSRDDVTDALKGMWANGMLVRERYQG